MTSLHAALAGQHILMERRARARFRKMIPGFAAFALRVPSEALQFGGSGQRGHLHDVGSPQGHHRPGCVVSATVCLLATRKRAESCPVAIFIKSGKLSISARMRMATTSAANVAAAAAPLLGVAVAVAALAAAVPPSGAAAASLRCTGIGKRTIHGLCTFLT